MNLGDRERTLRDRMAQNEADRKAAGLPTGSYEIACDTCGFNVKSGSIAELAVRTHGWYIHPVGGVEGDGCPLHLKGKP